MWYTSKLFILTVIGMVIVSVAMFNLSSDDEVDFSAAIKPIINKHCISCHGGVKKNGGFSLLFEEEAFAETESGKPAIVPGDAEHSELIRRLRAEDPEELQIIPPSVFFRTMTACGSNG